MLITQLLHPQVGRRKDPVEDAAVVKAIRDRIGPDIVLRADANRRWTYDQAVQFANYVRSCDLQYLEVRFVLLTFYLICERRFHLFT